MLTVLLVRAAVDTALLRLAWPRELRAPGLGRAFWSCMALTGLAWVLLSPAVTLAFGAAVLPFSWPFLAALPIMLGIAAALSHGGVIVAWWRRLPPLRSVLWLLGSFLVLSASAAVIAHLGTAAALGVAAVTGMVNARVWYGLAGIAARVHPRSPASVPAKVLFGLPFAPIAAFMTLALVVGVARMMFTGAIQLPISAPSPVAAANTLSGGTAHSGTAAVTATPATATAAAGAAVLVVSGWGSSCCDAANGLRAKMPGADVRQFSYVGLDARDFPVRHGPSADDLPLPVLGDRIAAQLEVLHNQTHRPVDVVAESEGTLGVYAMLSRHPGLPIGSVVLLSPIVDPGQVSYPSGPDAASVSEEALNELNHLAGEISPYGPSGAQHLLNSVSEFGARYFADGRRPVRQVAALAGGGPARRRPDPSGLRPPAGRGGRPGLPRRPPRRRQRPAHGQRLPRRPAGQRHPRHARSRRGNHGRGGRLANARHPLRLPRLTDRPG